jgi:hypothetical protein
MLLKLKFIVDFIEAVYSGQEIDNGGKNRKEWSECI